MGFTFVSVVPQFNETTVDVSTCVRVKPLNILNKGPLFKLFVIMKPHDIFNEAKVDVSTCVRVKPL